MAETQLLMFPFSNCMNTMMEPSAANIQVKTKI